MGLRCPRAVHDSPLQHITRFLFVQFHQGIEGSAAGLIPFLLQGHHIRKPQAMVCAHSEAADLPLIDQLVQERARHVEQSNQPQRGCRRCAAEVPINSESRASLVPRRWPLARTALGLLPLQVSRQSAVADVADQGDQELHELP